MLQFDRDPEREIIEDIAWTIVRGKYNQDDFFHLLRDDAKADLNRVLVRMAQEGVSNGNRDESTGSQ